MPRPKNGVVAAPRANILYASLKCAPSSAPPHASEEVNRTTLDSNPRPPCVRCRQKTDPQRNPPRLPALRTVNLPALENSKSTTVKDRRQTTPYVSHNKNWSPGKNPLPKADRHMVLSSPQDTRKHKPGLYLAPNRTAPHHTAPTSLRLLHRPAARRAPCGATDRGITTTVPTSRFSPRRPAIQQPCLISYHRIASHLISSHGKK